MQLKSLWIKASAKCTNVLIMMPITRQLTGFRNKAERETAAPHEEV